MAIKLSSSDACRGSPLSLVRALAAIDMGQSGARGVSLLQRAVRQYGSDKSHKRPLILANLGRALSLCLVYASSSPIACLSSRVRAVPAVRGTTSTLGTQSTHGREV